MVDCTSFPREKTMEIGVYHEFHCRPDQTAAAAFEEALGQIEAADRWGLDAIWLAEIHQQARRSVLTAPLTVAAAIAARTRRIKIGTGVQVLPLCHPLRLAEETATIDQISKGRLLFGVGRSGNPRSYVAYGVPYSESRERFLETLEIVKRAWTQPTFSYDGKYYSFKDASAVPRPYQKPCPPIRVAAASEETFPSLGEAGYPIFVAVRSGSLSGLAPDLAAYRGAYREAGHPGEGKGEVYLRLTLHIADTDRQAREEAEQSIMSGYRTLSTRLENSPNRRRAAEAETVRTISYEEVMRDKVIIGSPESVADRLRQLHAELGLDGILAELNFGAQIPPQAMTRSLQLLCEKVMPRLQ
jgi:alkanesulfonate monooxygenase SsuD/methylene tetrahydromethanopterin reductase-like flavin-dependent oxidoreductase (luciferase family)